MNTNHVIPTECSDWRNLKRSLDFRLRGFAASDGQVARDDIKDKLPLFNAENRRAGDTKSKNAVSPGLRVKNKTSLRGTS